jgi:hypothetical protein
MTLFEAKAPDPRDEAKIRKHRRTAVIAAVALLALGAIAFHFRYWSEEKVADKFFNLIEQKNYEGAYALWQSDPDWKQHTDRYSQYPFGQFQLDWGPSGDYGEIKSHKISDALAPRNKNGPVSGVVVVFNVNDRVQPGCLWVEKKTKALSFSPVDCPK